MDQLAPRDLYLTVTQGRGSMPAMQSLLSQVDRWAVIDYLRAFSYDPTIPQEIGVVFSTGGTSTEEPLVTTCPPDQANPYAWDDNEAILDGQATYLIQCAMCHGPDGSGGLPNTPDFTSQEVNSDLMNNPGSYLCALTEGVGVMPAFGESLSEDELWQVLVYMGSLGEP
jgi:mono/diheme cytochrome c family protein